MGRMINKVMTFLGQDRNPLSKNQRVLPIVYTELFIAMALLLLAFLVRKGPSHKTIITISSVFIFWLQQTTLLFQYMPKG
jgi:hypothetical protein